MGYGKEKYGYSIIDSGNATVSVGDGEYGMKVTTPAGKLFSRDGYDTFEGAVSGAQQSIENMMARPQVGMLNSQSLVGRLTSTSLLNAPFPGILNDDGRSA